MGKQTDAHIAAVNTELGKLKTAMDHMGASAHNFDQTWGAMMHAFDHNGGKAGSSQYGNTLKNQADTYDTAVGDAKKALTAAQQAVTNFDTFVTQKDAATKNPLKKTSIGKAKKFVVNAKAALTQPSGKLSGATAMKQIYEIGKGLYY